SLQHPAARPGRSRGRPERPPQSWGTVAAATTGAGTARTVAAPPVVPVTALAGTGACGGRLALGAAGRGLDLVDPHLHADPAEGGTGLVETVVDVRAERVQRHPALAVALRPRHLSAAQTARALHPDALGAALHGRLLGLAHGTPERDAAGQLLGHALRDELGVEIGRASWRGSGADWGRE